MASFDYSSIATSFAKERRSYEKLASVASKILGAALKEAGIYANVSGRAKEVKSLATKAVLGRRYEEPLAEIGDRAGVRVVVPYLRDVDRVEEVVRQLFTVINREQKLDALAYNEVGYLGVHFDTRLSESQITKSRKKLRDLNFEIQVRTIAQSAWAEVAHERLYKPPAEVPKELKRRIYRLVGLVELFDAEVEGFLAQAEETTGYQESFALAPFADLLLRRFDVRRKPDPQISLLLAARLIPLYELAPSEIFEHLDPWIDKHQDRLAKIFDSYEETVSAPIFCQPESFLLFERLENDRARLRAAWPLAIPDEWLFDAAAIWGVRLTDSEIDESD